MGDIDVVVDEELAKVRAVNVYEPALHGGVKTEAEMLKIATDNTDRILNNKPSMISGVHLNLRDIAPGYAECAAVERDPLFITWGS